MTDLFTTASAFRSLAATLADGPTADHASARCVGCRLPFLAEDLDAHGQCDSCCPEAMVYCENLDCELDVPSADLVPGGCVHCCCPTLWSPTRSSRPTRPSRWSATPGGTHGWATSTPRRSRASGAPP